MMIRSDNMLNTIQQAKELYGIKLTPADYAVLVETARAAIAYFSYVSTNIDMNKFIVKIMYDNTRLNVLYDSVTATITRAMPIENFK